MTPSEYVKACEEAYELCVFLPFPETLEQYLALDEAHPETEDYSGWADCVDVPAEWYAERNKRNKKGQP